MLGKRTSSATVGMLPFSRSATARMPKATSQQTFYSNRRWPGIPEGEPAVSPPTFSDLNSVEDFKRFGDRVRELTGGIQIEFKLNAYDTRSSLR